MKTLLRQDEVAELRRVSRSTLQRERRNGNGPPFLVIRRQIFYDRQKLLDWLDKQNVHSMAEKSRRDNGILDEAPNLG